MRFPYETSIDSLSVDVNERRLMNVVKRFTQQQAKGAFPGGQLVVRRYNQVLLNLAVGIARGYRTPESNLLVNVQPQTPFPVYSIGKPLAAIAIAMLEERGLLNVNTPITAFIPEFACHGKQDITILNMLTHTAGIIMPDLSFKKLRSRAWVLEHVTRSIPKYKRGTFAYLPIVYGVVLCEVVRLITGKTLSEFIKEEIAIPLDLPALRFGLAGRALDSLAYSYWLGKKKFNLAGANLADNFEEINNAKALFDAENPAFSLVTDAASLAAFFEFLLNKGISHSGKQLLSEESIRKYTTVSVSGWNKSVRAYMAVGRGFQVGTWVPSLFGWSNIKQCFGHGGSLSSVAFGDYNTGMAVAIITNGNRSLYNFCKQVIPLNHDILASCL